MGHPTRGFEMTPAEKPMLGIPSGPVSSKK
jgi:hypothetical protein